MLKSFSLLLFVGMAACASGAEDAESCALTPVFMEEFDDLSVAARELGDKRWTAHTPWYGDFGDAIFLDPRSDYPFAVKDGILRITAEKRTHKDVPDRWVSGLLAAADRSGKGPGAQYGYFEARMKMPPGKGTWPAFWLMPQKRQPATNNLEVDIIEYYGHASDEYKVVQHVWKKPQPDKPRGSTVDVEDGLLVREFNRFGADISPEWVVYMFNGEEVWRHPTPPEHTTKLYPLVNLALGSGWPIDETPDPSVLEVDYVRVWERGAVNGCALGRG